MKRYVVLEKSVGQTPLECMEKWRAEHLEYQDVPLAYAGRLDPMASGKLLVLIGDECKEQKNYHALDKEYVFEVLFGVSSDSGDVLGIVEETGAANISEADIRRTLATFPETVTLPYPRFSAKTVQGKPLHTWTVEGRIDEIEIPTYTANVFKLKLESIETKTRDQIYREASEKIETIPPVTDPRKALGNDFRRPEVRASWKVFHDARIQNNNSDNRFTIARIRCAGSSGLYMRTLAEEIAKRHNTVGLAPDTFSPVAEGARSATGEKVWGLAYSIHRTKIGNYQTIPFTQSGFWLNKY